MLWERAIEILRAGKVRTVTQTHRLDVDFQLNDGTRIQTKEPYINAILDEIKKCGRKCKDILVETE